MTALAAGIADAAGNALDGNGDGTGGDDYAYDFFVLAGDATRDRVVNFDDLLALAKNYSKTGATFAQGDFNYDGTVNFDDLLMLAKDYNKALPAPTAATAAAAVTAASALADEAKTTPAFSTTRVATPAASKPRPAPVQRRAAVKPTGR